MTLCVCVYASVRVSVCVCVECEYLMLVENQHMIYPSSWDVCTSVIMYTMSCGLSVCMCVCV